MSAPRLTPHQRAVVDSLRQGLVIRALAGWQRSGLFRPGERTALPGLFVRDDTVRVLSDAGLINAFNPLTGAPIPMRSPGVYVEYRLAPESGVA